MYRNIVIVFQFIWNGCGIILNQPYLKFISLYHCKLYSSGFQVLTFEESSKDVQEAEEEIPVAAAEEMLEAEEEEEEKDNKEEKAREEEKEEGEGDDEGGAEELQ